MSRSKQRYHALMHVEYDGTPYKGWTKQRNYRTVEGDLLAAFSGLKCQDVELRCAGRTDAGVHAKAQIVDARYQGVIPPHRLAKALAGQLPRELRVHACEPAPAGFNARRAATSRSYEYRLLTRPIDSPIRGRFVAHHPAPLNEDLLHEAAKMVLGKHRFTAFTPARTKHVFFDRTVDVSRWSRDGDELIYEIRANAFLRHMVRILVGTMLEIGRGDRTLEEFASALDGGERASAGKTAPPQGLCLVGVTWRPQATLPLSPDWLDSGKEDL